MTMVIKLLSVRDVTLALIVDWDLPTNVRIALSTTTWHVVRTTSATPSTSDRKINTVAFST